jgi:Xaa-Pro aminopeptidase
VDVAPLIKELRAIKSPYEIGQMKKSGAIFTHVFARAKEVIREGATEVEIDSHLVAEGRRRGHQGFPRMRGFNQEMLPLSVVSGYSTGIPSSFDGPIAGLGVTPALPQCSSYLQVEPGNPVLIDYAACYNGYCTDETRVFSIGALREPFKNPYEVSRKILEDAESFGKAGVNTKELFQRAMEIVKRANLADHFMGHGEGQVSFIGHGLGLEMNELPIITAKHSRVLQEGMVFAYEPKFIFPGVGAIGLELSFIVRKDRLERISDVPLDIVYV